MRFKLALVVCCLCLTAATVSAEVDARMLRYPDVSETHIAFVYAGDIWVVEKGGGTANRLSSPPGEEQFPRFSPDGSRLAFTGNYDGNSDIYVIPAMGGTPKRLTYHPDTDLLFDWTPDGTQLLFSSRRASGVRSLSQLYLVSVDGGFPEVLPYPTATSVLSRQRERPSPTQPATAASAPGSATAAAWHRTSGSSTSRPSTPAISPTTPRTTRCPCGTARPLYFLSDRGPAMRSNIWALDTETGETRQVTHFTDFDITFPAIGPSDIVFQAGGRLYLLGLESQTIVEVEVEVVTDLADLRPRQVSVSKLIQGDDISPTGKRAVIQARGELFSVPAEHGVVSNLSRSSGSANDFPPGHRMGSTSPIGAMPAVSTS